MIEVFGETWHFNLNKIDEFVNLPVSDTGTTGSKII